MYYRTIARSILNFKINPIIKILILSDFVVLSASNLCGPIFALFIVERISGAGLEVVGIASMIYFIFKALFEVPVGIFIDRTKAEKDDLYTALFGTILTAGVYFLFSYINTVWELYLLHALLGIGAAVAFPGWYSIFTHHIDKEKEAFEWSVYDVMIGIGAAGASAIGALIADLYGYNALFFIVSGFTGFGALLLFIIRKKVHQS